jgi:hypothetical protein
MDNMVTADNDWRNTGITDGDTWASYDIGGNISLSAAITALFVYSQNGCIHILPSGRMFKSGSVKGVLTESGAEVDLQWEPKKGIKLSLKAKQSCVVNIALPEHCRRVVKGPPMDKDNMIRNIELQGGKITAIEIKV